MNSSVTIKLNRNDLKFSAAHFTIFSKTERERLHGHNYGVSARIVANMGENGFAADYNVYKRCLQSLCDAHDEYVLLAKYSPWLHILEKEGEYLATFAGKTLRFPVDETLLLPVVNITVEELSYYFLNQVILEDQIGVLRELEIYVSSGAGQSGSALWRAEKNI